MDAPYISSSGLEFERVRVGIKRVLVHSRRIAAMLSSARIPVRFLACPPTFAARQRLDCDVLLYFAAGTAAGQFCDH